MQVDAIGTMAFDSAEPIRRDAIFRMASLTKPIVAAAAMMLVEDGVLALDEPVDRLLPELADRRVLLRIDGPLDDTYPAKRSITVEDLHWGRRLLSERSVEQMTTSRLTAEQIAGGGVLLSGSGWGFGMAVTLAPDEISPAPGRYGWAGGCGTTWYYSPPPEASTP